jgi:hypothetical protein
VTELSISQSLYKNAAEGLNVSILQFGPSDETGKTVVPCHSSCGTIKIPPCSKALSAEHIDLNFAALHR